jgi:hypothetical protein
VIDDGLSSVDQKLIERSILRLLLLVLVFIATRTAHFVIVTVVDKAGGTFNEEARIDQWATTTLHIVKLQELEITNAITFGT